MSLGLSSACCHVFGGLCGACLLPCLAFVALGADPFEHVEVVVVLVACVIDLQSL